MTQLDLARQMGVTDKAVSKWERDLSFPNVASLPKLAEELGCTVDELLEVKPAAQNNISRSKAPALIELVLKAVALAMGSRRGYDIPHGQRQTENVALPARHRARMPRPYPDRSYE